MTHLKFNFLILFIISTVSANKNLSIRSDHDSKVEFEMPVEIINNYLLKYFSNKKLFVSFLMQASDQMEHKKQTEIIDNLYTKSINTHFPFMNADIKDSLKLRKYEFPFLLIFVDSISSFV